MFVSSLLWLLVSQYTRDMIAISSLFTRYYTTYFYAYWWLELWLSQINYRIKNDTSKQNPFWYQDEVTFTGYNSCSSDSCWFVMDIGSRSSVISDSINIFSWCNAILTTASDEAYNVDVWDGFIIPLFYDTSTWFSVADYEVITNTWSIIEFEDLDPQLYNQYATWWTSQEYIVKILDEDVLNYDVFVEPTTGNPSPISLATGWLVPYFWSETPENKNYLIVANATWSTKQFCLQLDGHWPWGASTPPELPLKYMRVTSQSEFNDTTVSFGAIKTNELPSYLIYGTINP